jgi:hypothetical protein
MGSSSLLSRTLTALLGLLVALCGGAVWPVVALLTGSDAPWMAFASTVTALLAASSLAMPSQWLRAAVAAAYAAIGIAYAQYLIAAGVIAGTLGVPVRTAIFNTGTDLAFAMARSRNSATALALMLVAVGVAALLAARMGRPSPR